MIVFGGTHADPFLPVESSDHLFLLLLLLLLFRFVDDVDHSCW